MWCCHIFYEINRESVHCMSCIEGIGFTNLTSHFFLWMVQTINVRVRKNACLIWNGKQWSRTTSRLECWSIVVESVSALSEFTKRSDAQNGLPLPTAQIQGTSHKFLLEKAETRSRWSFSRVRYLRCTFYPPRLKNCYTYILVFWALLKRRNAIWSVQEFTADQINAVERMEFWWMRTVCSVCVSQLCVLILTQ